MQYENNDIFWDSTSNENGWVGIQGLYAEGDTLEDFIKNAYAVKVDQDGGDVGFVEIDELPEEAIKMLEEAYEKGN